MRREADPDFMVRHLAIIFFLTTAFFVNAQVGMPLNTWRGHPSFDDLTAVDSWKSLIIGASKSGIFTYDINGGEIAKITTTNGLSESAITALGTSINGIWVGHLNGKIDFWRDNSVNSMDDVFLANVDDNSKAINHFTSVNNLMYASTDFGIVVVNKTDLTIVESYRQLGDNGNSIPILKTIVANGKIYALTENRVLVGNMGDNLLDYTLWKRTPFHGAGGFTDMAIIDGIVHTITNNALWGFKDGEWLKTNTQNQGDISDLTVMDNALVLAVDNMLVRVSENSEEIIYEGDGAIRNIHVSGNGMWWINDENGGILHVENNEYILPNGPGTDHYQKLVSFGRSVAVIRLPYAATPNVKVESDYSIFWDGGWLKSDKAANEIVDIEFLDSRSLLLISVDGSFYRHNISESLFEQEGEVSSFAPITDAVILNDETWFATHNAGLEFVSHSGEVTRSFQTGLPYFIRELKTDGRYLYGNIDPQYSAGLIVFDPQTGNYRILSVNPGEGGLPGNRVFTLELDHDNQLWVGTNNGLAYFPFIQMEGNINAILPVVDFFPLLRNKEVTTLEVDPGNRKWVGTREGVWLFNESASEELAFYNTRNSPLLSDHILDIGIVRYSGEVFVLTSAGLISYSGDAIENMSGYAPFKIFPNPVYKGFEGKVGISGVPNNSLVKITDITGGMIWQGRSNGGIVSWDVHDYKGERVKSGVYLVFASDENGNQSKIGKIAVIN